MATFIVLGSFTDQGIKSIKESPKRSDAFKALAAKAGVKVKDIYWTLGHYDIVTIVEAPDTATATSLGLSITQGKSYNEARTVVRAPAPSAPSEIFASYFSAASTARFAITVTRCARYSALACRSVLRPSRFCLTLATDSGANFALSAFSMSAWRNTPGPAPVTATRTLPPKSATNTPTMAKREAGFLNFM